MPSVNFGAKVNVSFESCLAVVITGQNFIESNDDFGCSELPGTMLLNESETFSRNKD